MQQLQLHPGIPLDAGMLSNELNCNGCTLLSLCVGVHNTLVTVIGVSHIYNVVVEIIETVLSAYV